MDKDLENQIKEILRINKLMCKDMDLLARELEILKNASKVLCKDYLQRMNTNEEDMMRVMYR